MAIQSVPEAVDRADDDVYSGDGCRKRGDIIIIDGNELSAF